MRVPPPLVVCMAVLVAGAAIAARQTPQTPPAQSPPQAPPVFRAGTDVVRLDVSVLDKSRKPVRGLKPADFNLLEDGKPQQITVLSEVAVPEGYAAPPVWSKAALPDVASNDIGDKRLFAIVFDGVDPGSRVTTPLPSNILSRRADPGLVEAITGIVRRVINRLGPGDMAAIIGGGCFQPFTDDRDRLKLVLDSLQPAGPTCPPFITRGDRRQQRPVIRDIAEYLSVVPQRRKAIIYIGTGAQLNAGGGRSAGSGRGGAGGGGRNPQQDTLSDTLWFAQLANVNIYPINPYVLGPGGVGARLDSMRTLAQNTGGIAILDSTAYEADLDQVFVENGSYYILGYQTARPSADGRFHRLSVKVAGQPDLIVRARDQWYRPRQSNPDGVATAEKPSDDVASRLEGLLPNLDVTFDASVLPFAGRGASKTGVAIVTELTEPVAPGTTHVVQRMDLRVIAYNEAGDVSGSVNGSASLDVVPSVENQVRYALLSHLDLAPGRYSLRLVAHNPGTDKVGSAEIDVTVPDFAREAVSLSGVALAMSTAASTKAFGTLEPLLPVVPTALRAFLANDRVTAFARVYQGGTEPVVPVSITIHLLDAAGAAVMDRTVAVEPELFNAARAADIRVDLPIARLKSGPYLLTIEAALGSRHSPTRDVRFAIR